MDKPKLSIIIVSWNTRDLLRQCLGSIFKGDPGITLDVSVVDNASGDGSPDMVEAEFPRVYLIRNRENLGFGRANNLAIPRAAGEYVLLLNPDTIIGDNSLFREWTSFMDNHPEAGASGARLTHADGKHQVGDGGFRPSLAAVFFHALFLSKVFPRLFKGLFLGPVGKTLPMEVDWISGAAFMVRKSILPETGLLNEHIFMFAEDVEWGCRIRSFGYKVYYLPQITIVHLQGASIKKREDRIRMSFLWIESMRYVYSLLYGARTLWLFNILLGLGFLLRAVVYRLFYRIGRGGSEAEIMSRIMARSFLFALAGVEKTAPGRQEKKGKKRKKKTHLL